MTEQTPDSFSFKKIFDNNMNVIIALAIVVVVLIIYNYFTGDNTATIKVTDKECKYLDPDIQQKIADDIHNKLKEIDSCDCKTELSESAMEKFGNTNFY